MIKGNRYKGFIDKIVNHKSGQADNYGDFSVIYFRIVNPDFTVKDEDSFDKFYIMLNKKNIISCYFNHLKHLENNEFSVQVPGKIMDSTLNNNDYE